MNNVKRPFGRGLFLLAYICCAAGLQAGPLTEAKVTRIIKDVKIKVIK